MFSDVTENVNDDIPHDLLGEESHDLVSRASDSDSPLVAPEPEKTKSIKVKKTPTFVVSYLPKIQIVHWLIFQIHKLFFSQINAILAH